MYVLDFIIVLKTYELQRYEVDLFYINTNSETNNPGEVYFSTVPGVTNLIIIPYYH